MNKLYFMYMTYIQFRVEGNMSDMDIQNSQKVIEES